jgi:hypothetical protein
MWKGNGNTIKLLFSLKGSEVLYQERRRQMNTVMMEYFNNILFGPAKKQHIYRSIILFTGLIIF